MPLQNRVDPFSRIHAVPARGAWMGNRGILHDYPSQTLTKLTWATDGWVICTLKHKDWHRDVMPDGAYTSLFFLDEATALAAGHRPCYLCRNSAAKSFADAIGGDLSTPEIGKRILADIKPHVRKYSALGRESVNPTSLPSGAIFAVDDAAYLVWKGKARKWNWEGYGPPERLPETAARLTPATTCAALRGGYRPQIKDLQDTA